MNGYARRRTVIEDALQTADGAVLANNEISRLLGVSVLVVRRVRRNLEALGVIPRVYFRMSRRGYYIDVSRLTEVPSRKPRLNGGPAHFDLRLLIGGARLAWIDPAQKTSVPPVVEFKTRCLYFGCVVHGLRAT